MDINVAWVRLVFLLPLILRIFNAPFDLYWLEELFESWLGVFFVTYIVLWIALPMAVTPRQKLEARGQKITSASIRQNMQSAVHTPSGQKAASITAELVTVLGRVMLFCVKFVVAIVGFSLLFAAIGILTGMLAVPFAPTTAVVVNDMDILPLFEGMAILSPVMFVELILLCVMLPFLVVGMALLSFTFSWRLGRTFYGITLGLWVLAVIFTGIVSTSNARFFRDELPDRLERWGHWSDDYHWEWDNDDDWHDEGAKLRESLRDADGVNVDFKRDSLVIMVKRDGTPNDTIKITPEGVQISAEVSDSLPTVEPAPDIEGRRRVEIRRVE
jgi:hypothetical protein